MVSNMLNFLYKFVNYYNVIRFFERKWNKELKTLFCCYIEQLNRYFKKTTTEYHQLKFVPFTKVLSFSFFLCCCKFGCIILYFFCILFRFLFFISFLLSFLCFFYFLLKLLFIFFVLIFIPSC